jgi:hypothetical protein
MSLSRAQVTVIVNTEPFRTQLAEMCVWLPPLLWKLSMLRQRRRSRVVTRRKQRRSW